MRPCVIPPLVIRGAAFGGPRPLFCVPLVAADSGQLLSQARVAHSLEPDVVEWRADAYSGISGDNVVAIAHDLRSVLGRTPIIFTLRSQAEGGAAAISQENRARCLDVLLRSGSIDLIDVELGNGPRFLEPVVSAAREQNTRVILSFHDFGGTPGNQVLLDTIAQMIGQGADIAKIACMPREPADVLRLLQVTAEARQTYPTVPLCTMSMGRLGSWSRVVGFLYGCDMAFAVGQEVSAPGQIPLAEARAMTESLLRYA